MRFVTRMAAYGLLLLLFLGWWFLQRGASRSDRWRAFGLVAAGAVVAALLADKTVGPFLVVMGLPFVLMAWTVWLLLTKNSSRRLRWVGFCILTWACWGYFDLVRWNGLNGSQQTEAAWRWNPTAEQLFLAERATTNDAAANARPPAATAEQLVARPGDWTEFRGSGRRSRVEGFKLATDWTSAPPRRVWQRRVGPGWSGLIVVDGRLFTQEQRGDEEAVVCHDAATGKELWSHQDKETRFYEGLSGAGPRGTPTFAAGRLYSLGAKGKLNCLDAATGRAIWSRDIVAESGAALPQWGFSGSPLVVDGRVIVYAGGEPDKGVLAYQADSGEPVWHAAAGKVSYSSAQLATLGGESQVLILSDHGLTSLAPATGGIVWELPLPPNELFMPVAQPQVVADNQVLIQSSAGVSLVDVARKDDKWSATRRWESKSLKLSLNDFVVQDGSVYGFDDGIFCCIDLKQGKRRWKDGRFGHGQVLLLADQPLLLAISETGEAILLEADPAKLVELGRFQAIHGKTWNHPIIAHGRLYLRNAEEMACYELKPLAAPEPARVSNLGR